MKDDRKDEEESKGGAILPGVARPVKPRSWRSKIAAALTLILERHRGDFHYLLLGTLGIAGFTYLSFWAYLALVASGTRAGGQISWKRPPTLSELAEAVSQLTAPVAEREDEPEEADSSGPKLAAGPPRPSGTQASGARSGEGSASLAPPPRLHLVPWLAGDLHPRSGAMLEARDTPKPPDTSLHPTLRKGALPENPVVAARPEPRRKYRYCKPGEKPRKEDPCIADASQSWVKWPLGLHPKAFTVTPEILAKLRDPGPYPENIIDEEEEYRPRSPPVMISQEDIDAMFEAVTGIPDGQTLRSRRAYSQLLEARGFAQNAAKCPFCKPESKAITDRGSYFGERMKME